MHHSRISRRTVLRGLGAAIALPWLEAMSPVVLGRSISASTAPLRMAFLYVPNGMHMADWSPSKAGSDYEMTPIIGEFGKHRDQFNVLSGLTLNNARALGDGGGDHARSVAAFLTGSHPKKTHGADIHNGVSIDQLAAAKLGEQTRLASLELGTEASSPSGQCDSGYSCAYVSNLSWRTPTSPVAKEVDPAMVFDRLVRGTDLSLTPEERARRDRRRKSILDFVAEDAKALHNALGAQDKRKLDEYLFAVRDIEKRIGSNDKLNHGDSSMNDFERPEGVPREYSKHVELMLDMMVLAFQTDSTRISTFMFANAGSNRSYREVGVAEGHHDLSHHGNSAKKQEGIAKINHFHASMFNRFLEKMSSTREGENSLLDNSMVVYGSGISDGNRHNHDDLPIIFAGNGGGRFVSGRHIKFKGETPLTNLYLTMLQQSGIEAEAFSDSTGTLDELLAT
ncbi:MAG: DUF1552 domain-containing protein [Pirellulaceae bacterium]